MAKKYDYDRVSDFVSEYWRYNKRSPSLREIQTGCEISSTYVVSYILDILHERGVLVCVHDGTARNIFPKEVWKLLESYYENN